MSQHVGSPSLELSQDSSTWSFQMQLWNSWRKTLCNCLENSSPSHWPKRKFWRCLPTSGIWNSRPKWSPYKWVAIKLQSSNNFQSGGGGGGACACACACACPCAGACGSFSSIIIDSPGKHLEMTTKTQGRDWGLLRTLRILLKSDNQ